jgi:hypothetical protein
MDPGTRGGHRRGLRRPRESARERRMRGEEQDQRKSHERAAPRTARFRKVEYSRSAALVE